MVTRKDVRKKQAAVKRPVAKRPPSKAAQLQQATATRRKLQEAAVALETARIETERIAQLAKEHEAAVLKEHLDECEAPPQVEMPAPEIVVEWPEPVAPTPEKRSLLRRFLDTFQ